MEKLSFDAYNEADVLITAIERYYERTGHYPERVLVDQINRKRANLAFCRKHNIRISRSALGRPRQMTKDEKKQAYCDNTDWIGVERGFSLAKRSYGLGLIHTKLDTTTRSSIVLSIMAMNLDRITADTFFAILISMFSRNKWQEILPEMTTRSTVYKMATC